MIVIKFYDTVISTEGRTHSGWGGDIYWNTDFPTHLRMHPKPKLEMMMAWITIGIGC